MIRINLIPPEITQKRKSENRLAFVGLVFMIVSVVMGMFFLFMLNQVAAREIELASAQQELETLNLQAERFKVFEDKEAELTARVDISVRALDGRIDWGRFCEELSLVLPDDVWLSSLTASEENGVQMAGTALDQRDDVPDVGHKGIARTLVRLANLEQLNNVWLTSSAKVSGGDSYLEDQIDFQVTALVTEPQVTADEPAPPAQTP